MSLTTFFVTLGSAYNQVKYVLDVLLVIDRNLCIFQTAQDYLTKYLTV